MLIKRDKQLKELKKHPTEIIAIECECPCYDKSKIKQRTQSVDKSLIWPSLMTHGMIVLMIMNDQKNKNLLIGLWVYCWQSLALRSCILYAWPHITAVFSIFCYINFNCLFCWFLRLAARLDWRFGKKEWTDLSCSPQIWLMYQIASIAIHPICKLYYL
jgi:hypothetical protein